MHLNAIDWTIVALYGVFSITVGLIFTKRASKTLRQFFTAGGALPWYLVGTSMVATTFSTDTPNLVTDIVRHKGVAGNWQWWAYLLTGMTTVFFYARLWRRSNVLTDLEFYELRYSGPAAAFLRGFRGIYLGFFFNILVMASVTLAVCKIANVLFGWSRLPVVLAAGSLALALSVFSGIWGVVVTDMVQFVMAMVGSITAAVWAVSAPEALNGLGDLFSKVPPEALSLLPDPSTQAGFSLLVTAMAVPFLIQWWATWYPGAEPGGGSYVAQRMLASKNERHALLATLWFNVAHYAIRPWPWIIVALASIVVYPDIRQAAAALGLQESLVNEDMGYPLMLRFLPHGLLGIMVASLLAAYISTIDTHLNWGASYLVNDCWRRFVVREASQKHYVFVGRVATVILMAGACAVSLWLESAFGAFKLILQVGAGTGLVFLLRWYWPRINAWSEISAMVTSAALIPVPALIKSYVTSRPGWPEIAGTYGVWVSDEVLMAGCALITTAVWLTVTFLTPPEKEAVLERFCRIAKPAGPLWRPIRKRLGPEAASPDDPRKALLGVLAGIALVYGALFATGLFLYGRYLHAAAAALPGIAGAVVLARVLPRASE